jgi:hypothetical protein
MNVIRRHLASPAMVVACLALAVSLGGVSYAAGVLPKNSVGTAQLKRKAVSRAKLRKNAVTTNKVKNGSLLALDFKPGQLPGAPQGPKGDTGRQGPKGNTGATGSPGLSGLQIVQKTETDGYAAKNVTAVCPAGKRAIAVSGSADTDIADFGEVAIVGSKVGDNYGWAYAERVKGSDGVGTWSLTTYVTCSNAQ